MKIMAEGFANGDVHPVDYAKDETNTFVITRKPSVLSQHWNEQKTPFLIGVAGGTASGKTTVCQKIMEKLGQDSVDQFQRRVICITQDSFYRELTDEEKTRANKGLFNFDHPDAFDNEFMIKTLQDISASKIVKIPVYDFRTHSCVSDETTTIYPADVVLFEGILIFYFKEIRDMFQMKLFVDTDSDTRLARRVLRDIRERGRDLEQVLTQYTTFVKPAFEEFCLPMKKYADVIIPRGAENTVAVDLIVQHVGNLVVGGPSASDLVRNGAPCNGSINGYRSPAGLHKKNAYDRT